MAMVTPRPVPTSIRTSPCVAGEPFRHGRVHDAHYRDAEMIPGCRTFSTGMSKPLTDGNGPVESGVDVASGMMDLYAETYMACSGADYRAKVPQPIQRARSMGRNS